MAGIGYPDVGGRPCRRLRHGAHLALRSHRIARLDEQYRNVNRPPLPPVVPRAPFGRDTDPRRRLAVQPPSRLGAIEGLEEVAAGDGSEFGLHLGGGRELLRQRAQPWLPWSSRAAHEVGSHVFHHKCTDQLGPLGGQAPGVQRAHGVTHQHRGGGDGLDRRSELSHETLGADRVGGVGIPSPVPRRVIGVDRAEAGEPRQLPRPRATTAHQTVDENQRAPGASAVGQRCGAHRPHLAGWDLPVACAGSLAP